MSDRSTIIEAGYQATLVYRAKAVGAASGVNLDGHYVEAIVGILHAAQAHGYRAGAVMSAAIEDYRDQTAVQVIDLSAHRPRATHTSEPTGGSAA